MVPCYSIFNPSALFAIHYAPFDKPFDRPFDKLKVLSNIEGLMVQGEVEGLMALSNFEGLCAKRLLDSLTLIEDPDAFIGRTLIIEQLIWN